MRRLLSSVLSAVTLMAGLASGPSWAADALRVSIMPVSSVVRGNADITLRITISNPNSTSVSVPVWQLPSDDVPTPILQVTAADGSRVPYIGPLVKWDPAALKAGVTFAPGASRVYVVELSALYDIGNGRFRVDYSQDGPGRFDATGLTARVFTPVNPAFFETIGRSKISSGSLTPSGTAGSVATSSCTTDQRSKILTAVSGATDYALGAKNYFTSFTSANATPRYLTWFGVVTPTRWSTVSAHFDAIHSAFTTQTVTVDCSCKKKNVYAYVYASQPYRIYVCSVFWNAPATGTDSKAGTLIHEMSHFTVVAGTSDYAYGQTNAKALATSNPDKAVANADNHEYFAENTPAR